ncbi:MAG: hypothetical protein WAW36_01030 [Methylovulum miyakonense]|uniref:hypothetical protein n=1 Tax=Methylovulum miyakonense TaxID=645578 RepID=UPI003BB76D57
MTNSLSIRFLATFLLWLCTNSVYSVEAILLSCQSTHGALSYLQPPRRVLIVPLLSGDSGTIGSKKWAEKPADKIAAFYRNRFKADVRQMRDIWSWEDYYQQAGQILQQSPSFDRLIFIGHGGFDGPILNDQVFWQDFTITGAQGKLLQFSESQPGLKDVLSIEYNINKNQIFTDYISAHWRELVQMAPIDIRHQLKGLEKQLQPLDQACFKRYCASEKLATARKEIQESRINICEVVCREPLFNLKSYVEISPERLLLFTNSLSSLVTADGLIFFGACNPGSEAPDDIPLYGDAKFLTNTTVAGGPYQSYVHLVSSATGRVTAGPIGDSSAEDIVNRVIRFESNNHQHFLCVVAPTAH